MQTKSRRARIAGYSGLAVLASVVCVLSSSPSARRWFAGPSRRPASAGGPSKGASHQVAAAAYSNLPLQFEENQGQTAREVRFVSHGSGYELFLTPDQAVLALHPKRPLDLSATHRMAFFRARREARKAAKTSVLRMRLANANKGTRIGGMDRLPGRVDYFLGGDPATWRTNVSSYARVKYADVYPGVDLVFYGNQRRLEYDFIVAPGADPKAIALSVEGARNLRLNARGDLRASIAGGEVELQKPVVYQQIHGGRREIACNYTISANHRVTFAVAKYDRSEPLVVDPVLIYSTYLGGESDDTGLAIALDSLGDAAVTGATNSLQFPTTAAAFTPGPLTTNNGLVFVTQMDPTGTHQLYSSYVGGTGGEFGLSVAYDSTGNIYVAGETDSTDFPTTANALKQGPNAGNTNGTSFIFEINPAASGTASLVYSSYLGGTQGGPNITEFGNGVATDSTGAVYVVGITASQPGTALANFPVTTSAFQSTPDPSNTSGTGFITKLDTTQSGSASLIYSSYLSGNGADSAGPGFGDEPSAVAEDSAGNTYIAGSTTSTNFPTTTASPSFPTVRTAFQPTPPAAVAGGTVFISRFDTTQSGAASLLYSSYVGGDSADFGDAIAVGPSNVAYLTGSTSSLLFPTTAGAFQTTGNTNSVAFITLLDTSMNGSAGLKYATFLGGSQTNTAFGIAADALGNAYVAGETQGADFPVTLGALEPSPASGSPGAGYVTKLNPGGHGAADLVYSTYFGGSGANGNADEIDGITLNPATNYAYLTGHTFSPASSFPIAPNPGAFQATLDGPSDAFIAELTLLPTLAVSPTSLTFGPQLVGTTTPAQMVTLTNNTSTATTFTSVTVTGGSPAAADMDFTTPSNTCGTSIAAGASCTIGVVFTPSTAAVETANLVITDADLSSPQTVTLTGTGTNIPLTVAPTNLAFGSQPVGSATPAQMVTLTNGYNAAIAFTTAVVSGGAPAAANTDFTATNTCGSSIAASTSCTISVVFKPSVAAAETANLVITDGVSTSPQTVTLTGTGTSGAASFTVTASPTTLMVAQGASGTFKVTVTPAGGFHQAVALACTGAPSDSTCTAAPTSVTPTDGVTPVSATVTVATTSPSMVTPPSVMPDPPVFLWRTVPLLLVFSLLLFLARRQRFAVRLGMAAAMVGFLALAGCSGGHKTSTGGTPQGNSTLTVTGTSGSLKGSATVSLIVN